MKNLIGIMILIFLGINAAQASTTVRVTIAMTDELAPLDTELKRDLAQAIRASEISPSEQSQSRTACKSSTNNSSTKRLAYTNTNDDYEYTSTGGTCP